MEARDHRRARTPSRSQRSTAKSRNCSHSAVLPSLLLPAPLAPPQRRSPRQRLRRPQRSRITSTRADDDDELNINPPTPCLGKRPQRPKPKGPGRPWGQKPLAHGYIVEGAIVPGLAARGFRASASRARVFTTRVFAPLVPSIPPSEKTWQRNSNEIGRQERRFPQVTNQLC